MNQYSNWVSLGHPHERKRHEIISFLRSSLCQQGMPINKRYMALICHLKGD